MYFRSKGEPLLEALESRLLPATAPILPDRLEDNDATAIVDARIEGGVNSPNFGLLNGTTTWAGLTMDDAADWYRFSIGANGTAGSFARIDFFHSQGDLDMQLYKSDGRTIVGRSEGETDQENISLTDLHSGTYYLRVYGYRGAQNPNYSLTISAPANSSLDPHEPNDTKALVDACPAGGNGSPNFGPLLGRRIITGLTMDDAADWYRFEITATCTAADFAAIDVLQAQGDLDMAVYKADGATLVGLSDGQSNRESVSLNGQPAGVYYVKVYGSGGAANPNYTLTIDTFASTQPLTSINVWYGSQQSFGQLGNPQRQINILGSLTNPDEAVALDYSLNGGSWRPLSVGANLRRLAGAGDFNVEIDRSSLRPGANSLVLRARDSLGNLITQTVTVNYSSGSTWPLPYTADWRAADSVGQVAQVVDGQWGLEGDSVRVLQPGYDRMLNTGDISWRDYEVTVPITIHGIDPDGYRWPSGSPGLGIVTRWQGHYAWNTSQPSYGWQPAGGTLWYMWSPDGQSNELHLENNYATVAAQRDRQLALETCYIWKMRTHTRPDGKTQYDVKVWPQGQPEPSTWDMTGLGDSATLATGSIALVAHHVDASFGQVIVTPL